MGARYFDLLREMKDAYNHRLRLVESARQRGSKPTARLFATTVPTVRKWLRRYQQHGLSGLREHSRAPHHQPRKTPPALELQLVELRRALPTFGARRLIREFDLPVSHRTLERIWRGHSLMPKRRKKYQRKQDLAAVKATWRLFQQISADTKDLCDIPRFWPQAERLRLPWVQYSAREVRSGLFFWAFAQRRSAAASQVFAARIQQHLDRYGVSLRDLVWQTDNGGEFQGRAHSDPAQARSGFPTALGDSQHVRIPPAAHTFQSDVETVHRLVEDEFFDLEDFSGRGDFLAKAYTYQLYFNLVRPNSHKENLSPWQIIQQVQPRSSLDLCLLPPVFLDNFLNSSGGYDLPRLPYRFANRSKLLPGKNLPVFFHTLNRLSQVAHPIGIGPWRLRTAQPMSHDVIVIGGSFAGLAAAMQPARARRRVLVVDSGQPRNRFAQTSHGFLGQDGQSPSAILAHARSQLLSYPTVRFVEALATHAGKVENGFAIALAGGETHVAARLILAAGVADDLTALPGLQERWGTSVLHCYYCHGYEVAGRRLGILATSERSLQGAMLLPDWSDHTALFTNNALRLSEEQRGALRARGVNIETEPVVELFGDPPALSGLRLRDGRTVALDALFTAPRTRMASPLAEQLGCEFDDGPSGPYIRTDASKLTTVPGVYAAGDAARPGHNASWAAADGVTAGISAHQSLTLGQPACR